VDVVVFAVELGQLGFEVGADRSHDLLHAVEMLVSEHLVPELRHENQMGMQDENAVSACANIA
jgi:hypothetical protein